LLQSMNGMSPIAYSAGFAANAAGMTVAALVAARLAGHHVNYGRSGARPSRTVRSRA